MNAQPFINPQPQGSTQPSSTQPSFEYGPGPNAYRPDSGSAYKPDAEYRVHGAPPQGVPGGGYVGGSQHGGPQHGVQGGGYVGGPQHGGPQSGGPQPYGAPPHGTSFGGNPPTAPPQSFGGGQYAGYGGGAMEGFDDSMSELKKYERDHRPPKHSQLSYAIMVLASVSLLLTFMSLFTKEWRSNSVGVVGYSAKRSWGLFSVVGQRTQSHYEVQQFTCRAFGGLSVGGICNSPICVWYKLKCQVYIQLMWVSYTAGLFIGIAVVIHMLCMYWTYNLTPRLIRWAGTWWFMDIFFQVGAIAFYSLMSEDLFASLDTKAIYPAPNFSMSFFFCCMSSFLHLIIALLAIILMKVWPEEDDDDDSDDELLEEDNFEFAMLDKRGCPAGAGAPAVYNGGPAAGYVVGPPAGYVGGPPAGYVGAPPAGYVGGPQAGYVGGPPAGNAGGPPAGYVGGPQAQPQHAGPPSNLSGPPSGAAVPAPINPSLGVSAAAGQPTSQGSQALQQSNLSDGARQSTE